MEIRNPRVVFHSHIVSNLKDRGLSEIFWANLLGNKRVKTLQEFVDVCSKQNQNTLVGITEFSGKNNMYDFIVDSGRRLKNSHGADFRYPEVYIGVEDGKGFSHYFFRTEEIQTPETRVLIVGGKEQIGIDSLENVLDAADRKGYLKIALRLGHSTKNIKLSKEDFENYAVRFDAIETRNFTHPNMFLENEMLAREYDLPEIWSFEPYNKKHLFHTHMEVDSVDVSDPRAFRESLGECLYNGRYNNVIVHEKNIIQRGQHLASLFYQNRGLLKEKK